MMSESFFDEPHPGGVNRFVLGGDRLTRFPPNVEQISVDRQNLRTWLVVRRNDVELRFPLTGRDCRHLAALLMGENPPGDSYRPNPLRD
jgi:hypothetical protein